MVKIKRFQYIIKQPIREWHDVLHPGPMVGHREGFGTVLVELSMICSMLAKCNPCDRVWYILCSYRV